MTRYRCLGIYKRKRFILAQVSGGQKPKTWWLIGPVLFHNVVGIQRAGGHPCFVTTHSRENKPTPEGRALIPLQAIITIVPNMSFEGDRSHLIIIMPFCRFFSSEVLGLELRALHLLGERCITELHPSPERRFSLISQGYQREFSTPSGFSWNRPLESEVKHRKIDIYYHVHVKKTWEAPREWVCSSQRGGFEFQLIRHLQQRGMNF